jgi:hypothetical protein
VAGGDVVSGFFMFIAYVATGVLMSLLERGRPRLAVLFDFAFCALFAAGLGLSIAAGDALMSAVFAALLFWSAYSLRRDLRVLRARRGGTDG